MKSIEIAFFEHLLCGKQGVLSSFGHIYFTGSFRVLLIARELPNIMQRRYNPLK